MTTAERNITYAALQRDFKRRLEQLEHEHVMRLMATFQEFKARAFAIKNGRPMDSPASAGGNGGRGKQLEPRGSGAGTDRPLRGVSQTERR